MGAVAVPALVGLGQWLSRAPHPAPTPPGPPHASSEPLQGVWVVLDPGHGGQDPGTTAGPQSEAALTYRLAGETAAELRALGAGVVFTVHSRQLDPALARTEPPPARPDDATSASAGRLLRLRHSPGPLWERAAIGRRVWTSRAASDPDAARDVFFLSLHFDQSPAPGVSGGVVCVDRRVRRIPALALALADELGRDAGVLRAGGFRGRRGLSGRTLGVLDPAYNPIPEKALLEAATLSDPLDAARAGDPAWRGELARRIGEAITRVHQARR